MAGIVEDTGALPIAEESAAAAAAPAAAVAPVAAAAATAATAEAAVPAPFLATVSPEFQAKYIIGIIEKNIATHNGQQARPESAKKELKLVIFLWFLKQLAYQPTGYSQELESLWDHNKGSLYSAFGVDPDINGDEAGGKRGGYSNTFQATVTSMTDEEIKTGLALALEKFHYSDTHATHLQFAARLDYFLWKRLQSKQAFFILGLYWALGSLGFRHLRKMAEDGRLKNPKWQLLFVGLGSTSIGVLAKQVSELERVRKATLQAWTTSLTPVDRSHICSSLLAYNQQSMAPLSSEQIQSILETPVFRPHLGSLKTAAWGALRTVGSAPWQIKHGAATAAHGAAHGAATAASSVRNRLTNFSRSTSQPAAESSLLAASGIY